MNAQRLSHADLEPSFRGSAGLMSSCGCDATPGLTGHNLETDSIESRAPLMSGTDWGLLALTFAGGLVVGGAAILFRDSLMGIAKSGSENIMGILGLARTGTADGPHAPFDPRTQDLNVGVGALSPQMYRSSGQAQRLGHVDEASEESFPASDPPSWTGVSSVGRCANGNE